MPPKSTTPTSDNNKPIEEMMKNLKVDPSPTTPSEAASFISSSGDFTTNGDQDYDQPIYYPPGTTYYGYYYPGYEASSVGEYDHDQGYYLTNDGLETQYHAVQGENGSFMYYMPGIQPGYVPYNPYMAGATNGIDGQYLNPHSYVLSPMSPQPIASSGYFPNPLSYGSDVMQSYVWDPSFQVVDAAQGNSYVGNPPVPGSKPYIQSHTIAPPKSAPSLKSNSEKKVSLPALDVSSGTGILNDLKPVDKATSVLAKSYYPVSKFPYSSQGKGGVLYPNNSVSYKANGRGWGGTEKFKTRGKGNGVSDFDVLNEQNRGPRTNSVKNISASETGPAVSLITDGDDKNNSSTVVIRWDDYNLPDFPTKYDHALFFVIKSYSEDDIHKSIKYNVWASTPNGNRRLDSAYQDAQEKMSQKGSKCPVFLFFSVNASGQFCGVAEMIGRVDFNKNMDFWQQDKWNGFFPVKWHFVKDVPNPHFRHIILENNDNKPVTNSRDTQEVRFPQGMNMLNVFKNHLLKTSILDDFTFYESRQKAMQDKRIRAPTPHLAPLQKLDDVQVVGNPQSVEMGDKQVVGNTQSVETGDAKNSEPVMGDKAKE